MKRKHHKTAPDRYEYLQCLIKEYYTTRELNAKKEVLANLANFSYNPINYDYFRHLNVIDVFLDSLEAEDKDLLRFALAGLCNLSADPVNKSIVINKGGVDKVSRYLKSDCNEIILTSIATLIYLVSPSSLSNSTEWYVKFSMMAGSFLTMFGNGLRFSMTNSFLKHLNGKRLLSDGESTTLRKVVTQEDVEQFGKLTGDLNTIHFSGPFPIVHGALLNGLVSGVIGTKLPGPGTIVVEQTLKFPNPCFANDELDITVSVTSARKIITVEFNILKISTNQLVLEGWAKLILPRK